MEDEYNEPMSREDAYFATHGVEDHPVDKLEPIQMEEYDKGYRDACRRYPFILNAVISFILLSENWKTACYQVAFALGLKLVCDGKSMEAIASRLGITRANLSKGAIAFKRSLNLPESTYMKNTVAVEVARKARVDRVNRKFNKPKEY